MSLPTGPGARLRVPSCGLCTWPGAGGNRGSLCDGGRRGRERPGQHSSEPKPNSRWGCTWTWFRWLPTGFGRRIRQVVDPRCPFPHGLAVEPRGEAWLRDALPEFDLLWFFKLRTANLFHQWRWPRSVVDIDDIPSSYERVSGKSASIAAAAPRHAADCWSGAGGKGCSENDSMCLACAAKATGNICR